MTPSEIEASMNFVHEFELMQYLVGIASTIAATLCGAIVFMYRDSKAERKEWKQEFMEQNERMINAFTKNTEAFNQVQLSNQRLADVVDRQERTTQNLEKLILEKLAH